MTLDHTSSVPLHLQAQQLLRQLIESEEYKNGKMLPKEVELSKQLNISRNTLRQALTQLVFEGLLVRKKGVGTKVARKGINGGVKNWLSFSQEMKMLGVEVKNYELRISYKKPNSMIADFFGIDESTPCVVLERVRGNTSFPFVHFRRSTALWSKRPRRKYRPAWRERAWQRSWRSSPTMPSSSANVLSTTRMASRWSIILGTTGPTALRTRWRLPVSFFLLRRRSKSDK